MIPPLRARFNRDFSEENYQRFLRKLDEACGTHIEFRPCETPVFLPRELLQNMIESAQALMRQLHTPSYWAASTRAIPCRRGSRSR